MSGVPGGIAGGIPRTTANMSAAEQLATLPPPEMQPEMPMAFQTFAAMIAAQPVRDTRGRITSVIAGDPNEVWLKFIKIQHGGEKHTYTQWMGLIAEYSVQPAHPAGMIE